MEVFTMSEIQYPLEFYIQKKKWINANLWAIWVSRFYYLLIFINWLEWH